MISIIPQKKNNNALRFAFFIQFIENEIRSIETVLAMQIPSVPVIQYHAAWNAHLHS